MQQQVIAITRYTLAPVLEVWRDIPGVNYAVHDNRDIDYYSCASVVSKTGSVVHMIRLYVDSH